MIGSVGWGVRREGKVENSRVCEGKQQSRDNVTPR